MKRLLLSLFTGALLLTPGFTTMAQNIPSGVTIHPAQAVQPRDSAKIIRFACRSTITDTKPLFVVDGKILDAEGFLATLNLADIEKILVLRGTGATSLYGSRGQYGVFLITTKHKPVVKPYPQRPMEGITAP